MGTIPPNDLLDLILDETTRILETNPAATSSEAFLQHTLEFALLMHDHNPRYFVRIGINYHGNKVQQIELDANGKLVGWNATGDALATGARSKMLLAGHTIFNRDPNEPTMNDTKIGGGNVPPGQYVRVEFKVRGWLGKTKNLDGKQFEKDIDLLKNDSADLMVGCLSEIAHRKWCGEGPAQQASRRTGTDRFRQILIGYDDLVRTVNDDRIIDFEGQRWRVRSRLVTGLPTSIMPDATHVITTVCKA
jgi:hypothetical protein